MPPNPEESQAGDDAEAVAQPDTLTVPLSQQSPAQLDIATTESDSAPDSLPKMQRQTRDGLKWDDGGLGVTPCWAREPQVDAIVQVCRKVLALGPEDRCTVTFHAEGGFNKVYIVDTPQGKSVMRVSLPVDAGHKTRGEVTTLRWVRRMTQIPVPKVIAFDDTQNNEIGFEWILMELMPGTSAYKKWRKMPMAAKTWITEQIAEFQSQLFRRSVDEAKFQSIGTLCSAEDAAEPARSNPKPGRVVSGAFFHGDRFNYDVPRGPFRSSHDWLSAQLELLRQEQESILANDDDQDTRDEAALRLKIAARPPEPTILWHGDLSLSNILVDDDGKVTGLVDWECVSCEPLWMAGGMPEFLLGPSRESESDRSRFGGPAGGENGDPELDDEGVNIMYWDHLLEYEQTQLRKVYAAKMKELCPQWETEATYRELKANFYDAVAECATGWFVGRVGRWITAVESGKFPDLGECLQEDWKA